MKPHTLTETRIVDALHDAASEYGDYDEAECIAIAARASTEALHTALKIRLGRFEPVYDLKGQVVGSKADKAAGGYVAPVQEAAE